MWFAVHVFVFVGGFYLVDIKDEVDILVYDNLERDLLRDTLFS